MSVYADKTEQYLNARNNFLFGKKKPVFNNVAHL